MFKHVINSSHTYKSKHNIFFRYKKQPNPFIGFILSKKFGNAVVRNKFKNQARNLYKTFFKDLKVSIIVRPLKKGVSYNELKKSFYDLSSHSNNT